MTSTAGEPVLLPVRTAFRALAEAIVPAAARLDERGWTDVEERIEAALRDRPPALRRQLRLLIQVLDWMPVLRYGHRFTALDGAARTAVLQRLQRSPSLLLRRGFWGLRTLVFLGYYGGPEARRAIGYRADPMGWEARRGMIGEGTGDEA